MCNHDIELIRQDLFKIRQYDKSPVRCFLFECSKCKIIFELVYTHGIGYRNIYSDFVQLEEFNMSEDWELDKVITYV